MSITYLMRLSAATGDSRTCSAIVMTNTLIALLCLRVAALYKGVRWVTWSLWIGFVLSQVIRIACTLLGTAILSGMLACHQGLSSLTPSHVGHMGYSNIGRQCLPRSSLRVAIGTHATALLLALVPTILDTFILTLTIVKAMKSNALSGSHPSSSIVRVGLHFGLWLKLI